MGTAWVVINGGNRAMYSLVLMAALTSGANAPDTWWLNRRSCYGGCYGSSCAGSCYGSCYGGSCYGSSCHGYVYSGCHGSCYGSSSCYGSACYGSSCYGSCYGSSCSGSAYYYSGSCFGSHSCYGCSGCTGSANYYGNVQAASYGYGYDNYNMAMQAPVTYGAPAVASNVESSSKKVSLDKPAKIIVKLPADAKLFVDGQTTKTSDKDVREFVTPDLQAGIEYKYVMKAEVTRDGVPITETRHVVIRSGDDLKVNFELPERTTASVK